MVARDASQRATGRVRAARKLLERRPRIGRGRAAAWAGAVVVSRQHAARNGAVGRTGVPSLWLGSRRCCLGSRGAHSPSSGATDLHWGIVDETLRQAEHKRLPLASSEAARYLHRYQCSSHRGSQIDGVVVFSLTSARFCEQTPRSSSECPASTFSCTLPRAVGCNVDGSYSLRKWCKCGATRQHVFR